MSTQTQTKPQTLIARMVTQHRANRDQYTLDPYHSIDAWAEWIEEQTGRRLNKAQIRRRLAQARTIHQRAERDAILAEGRDRVARLAKPGAPGAENGTPAHYAQSASNSGSNEWYTPPAYTDAARAVMGGIDLDPASNATAQQWIRANAFYNAETDGLSQRPWQGRIWLNPPYGRRDGKKGPYNADLWTTALLEEYEAGHVEQAILLIAAATDTDRTGPLWDSPVCLTDHRITFTDEHGQPQSDNPKGSIIVYLPPRDPGETVQAIARFVRYFEPFGAIVSRIGLVAGWGQGWGRRGDRP